MFDGLLTLTYPEAGGVVVTRSVYPSMTELLGKYAVDFNQPLEPTS
jgi:hypothetical protein